MSPRKPNPPSESDYAELRRLGQRRADTDAQLKALVRKVRARGASVRTVAEAAGLSTATVQAWTRD